MKASQIVLLVVLILFFTGGFAGFYLYDLIYAPAVQIPQGSRYLHLPSDVTYSGVTKKLYKEDFIRDTTAFKRVAGWMNYPAHVYPGRYRLTNNMSNRALIRKLRSADKAPVDLTLSSFRNIRTLSGYVSRRLEADSTRILVNMNDPEVLDQYGLDQQTRLCLFIPNTYEFSWNTKAKGFLDEMYEHYQRFWTVQRKAKANEQELDPTEAMILASIVQRESNRIAELDTIAGVYLNRLNRANMPLQADPTLQYILQKRGEKDVNRIYNRHKDLESPYNTYKYRGLPPGPITIPRRQAIKAVLNPADHDYLYFAAKPGKGGGHRFSETLREHNRKARDYQEYANEENIY